MSSTSIGLYVTGGFDVLISSTSIGLYVTGGFDVFMSSTSIGLCVTGGFSDWSSDSPQTLPSLQPSAALAVWTEAQAGALLSGTEPRRGVAAVVRRSPSGWRVR